jgi:internalin A
MSRSPMDQAIDDISAGRSTELNLVVTDDGLDVAYSRMGDLARVRVVVLHGDSTPIALPSWLGELPALERVDARLVGLTEVPSLPQVRFAVQAKTLQRCSAKGVLSQIDGVRVVAKDTASTIRHLVKLCQTGSLDLTELTISAESFSHGEDQKKAATHWRAFDLIDAHIDDILLSLPKLESLTLWAYPLGRVPEPLHGLAALTYLDLTRVLPSSLPGWIFGLPQLRQLIMTHNRLQELPVPDGVPCGLRSLILRNNPLRRLPMWIWYLTELELLDVMDCPVVEIPREVLHSQNLTTLRLGTAFNRSRQSAVQVPPPEVAVQGLDAIKAYWRQQQDAGIDHLAEAKLLIVGEPGAGKTSLARKVIDSTYALDAAEASTEGIDVLPWQFPGAIRVREDDGKRLLQRDIRVNIWDFGGQEIYHATHQFFLTKRSVYVLVTDERKEDTDFEYWLEIIDLLSDGSPVLIVQNRKQGRSHGIDLGAIRQRYPHMRDALVVDLADNSGLDAAVARIRRELEQLPHIGTPLPATWRDVRLALEADDRDHITADQFLAICAGKGFTRDDDMLQLGGYLHDLGICLFFQDDPLLRKTVILRPTWGTTAVYRVLDDPGIADALGVFTDDDLARIWHEPEFAPMRHELLRLMERFGLCYRVPGSSTWIAPQLLSPTQPVYGWPDDGNVVLRYEYDVMPKGIVRRLIVDLHNLLFPGDHVWRSGGVFAYGSTRAEVVEDYRRRQLRLRLQGADPRILLGIIDQAMAVIHASYPRIRFRKFLPCACIVCTSAQEPAMFALDELQDFARTGDAIQCRVSRKMVDPGALLRAFLPTAEQAPGRTTAHGDREPEQPRPEVFVSYKWGGSGETLVDDLQARLADHGVPLIRDKSTMRYGDSIRSFMRTLGVGRCIVIVVDDGYLRSENCMFELTQIARDPAFRSRIFPVIMSDATIFKPRQRLGYIKHWEEEIHELDAALKEVGPENLQGIREERDLYETIRNTIASIVDVLADMNALTPDVHRDTDFAQLYQALDAALSR